MMNPRRNYKTFVFVRNFLLTILLFVIFTLSYLNAEIVNNEVAKIVAQGHIDAVSMDFPNDYLGAQVTGDPTTCYDLEGNPSALIFDVIKNDKYAGYVTIGADSNGPLVIESSNSISPVTLRKIWYEALGKSEREIFEDEVSGEGRILYISGIDYYFAQPEDLLNALGVAYIRFSDYKPIPVDWLENLQSERNKFLSNPENIQQFKESWTLLSCMEKEDTNTKVESNSLTWGTIHVDWPSSANQYMNRGTQYSIRWTASGISYVKVELYKGGSFNRTITSSVIASQGYTYWTPPTNIVPGADYKVKITDTSNSSAYDASDNNFYITGSKVLSGVEAYTWYRGCVPTSETMVLNYIGSHGFPDLRHTVSDFQWNGPDGHTFNCHIARGLADHLAAQLGFPQSGGTVDDYGANLPEEISAVRNVVRDHGYGSWNTLSGTNPSADTYRQVIDKNRPGQMGFYGGNTTYNWHATCFMGYSFYTNSSARNQRIIYVFDTADFARHDVVYESQTGTGTILDYHDSNPPLMVVKYPNSSGITLYSGQTIEIKWGSWASQTGSSNVKIELYKGTSLNRTIIDSTPNDGSYSWTVSTEQTLGTDFKIKITSTTNTSIYDYSDNYFTISTNIIVLTVNGPTVTGNISPAGDVDWYQFTASSSGIYTIETWAGTLSDNYMYLYGPNSQSTLIEEDDDDGVGYAAKIVRSLSAGTYYVKIRAYSSTSTGTYTIQVRFSPPIPPITINAPPITGNITPAGDVDWYYFVVTSSGTYTIETWAGTLSDNYMYLYGPNSQTTLIEEDDDDGVDNAAKIVRSLSAGTYYVKIRAYSSTSTGTYTIQVRFSPPITPLTINASPVTGNITPAGDVDWYYFVVTSSGTYTIETWAGTLSDNYMYLYGPNSQTTLIEEDDDDGVDNAAKIVRSLSAGTYYVKIRAYSSTSTGTYTIQVRFSPPIPPITINASPITGNITPAGDVDWYYFVVTSSGTYTIETWAGTLSDNYMYLYGPNSQTTLIEEDDDDGVDNAAKIVRSLSAGTYYVKIRAYDTASGTGTYTIRVTTSGSIPVLTVNGPTVTGNISPAGDVDWYQFTASSSGIYTIETWAGTLSDNYMYLYGPNSQSTLIEEDDDDGVGYAAKIVRSLSAGTYYVKIRAYDTTSGTGTYTIRVTH